jgi:hypothetical protein
LEQDELLTPARRAKIKEFQTSYHRLYMAVAVNLRVSPSEILQGMRERTALINRYDRVTGDAVLYVGERLVKGAKRMPTQSIHAMFQEFVEQQVLRPEYFNINRAPRRSLRNPKARHILRAMLRDVRNLRSGI